MGGSDSEGYDSEELEITEAYDEALAGLRVGTVKCANADGLLRCPYSPDRKKQDYKYCEILQHAVGVGAGHRGPVAAGQHRALREYLEIDIAASAQPQAGRPLHLQLQQDVPCRVDSEEKRLLFPWMGILQNIYNRAVSATDGSRVGPCAADIKEKLKAFSPKSIKVMHDSGGHLGVAVIVFRNSMDGFKDAVAFEKSFDVVGQGQRDFERDYPNGCTGTCLYGWMATEKDVEGSNEVLSEHLKLNGDLNTLSETLSELEHRTQQRIQILKEVLTKTEVDLQATNQKNWSLTNRIHSVPALFEQDKSEDRKL